MGGSSSQAAAQTEEWDGGTSCFQGAASAKVLASGGSVGDVEAVRCARQELDREGGEEGVALSGKTSEKQVAVRDATQHHPKTKLPPEGLVSWLAGKISCNRSSFALQQT